ncbi:MAG TPA: proton-conducting transporter membrane subunit [Spirochaetota bacterium]|nr:proton-conducting transporter membrane subunit [Spirochaetota bacterium]
MEFSPPVIYNYTITVSRQGDSVYILLFLIVFPALAAFLLLVIPFNSLRKMISLLASVIICAASILLLLRSTGTGPVFYTLNSHYIDLGILAAEMATGLFLVIYSIWKGKFFAALLAFVQSGFILWFDLHMARYAVIDYSLFSDLFSVVMALIIGIIGTLICVYTAGYMDEFHEHHGEVDDRRSYFLFLMYLFISSMFGIVFSNHLLWLLFFWEVTTLCSFLLIGYKADDESVNSAFKALVMNLAGGIAFTAGIVILYTTTGQLELDKMISTPGTFALVPVVCLALAGLVKSAQMPFSSWLTAAMVAPTPVSALLHSSTMVKAGVYILIRIAPQLQGTAAGIMLAFIGGTTFLVASFIAVSQRNAKLVLAYSTIGNLGLITACAGIDSYMAVWSAILLIIFHAVSKSLLFLCTGVVQNRTGSRDIEDMDHLVSRMPGITAMIVIGIAGMFLAPFGMLISKWAALKAFVDFSPILAIMLAYGSAATLFFWAKWMGRIISIRDGMPDIETGVSPWEWFSLAMLSLSTVVICILLPVISSVMIEPYILGIYGESPVLPFRDFIIIIILMTGLVLILPLGIFYYTYIRPGYRKSGAYFCGRNMTAGTYMDYSGTEITPRMGNYYLENIFNERKLSVAGIAASVILIGIMFGAALI